MVWTTLRPLIILVALAALAPAALATDPDHAHHDVPLGPVVIGWPELREEENQKLSDAFANLLQLTGALGHYVDANGAIVVVVPYSGSSSFRTRDAAALGIDVTIQTWDIEPSDIDAIRVMVAARQWRPRDGGVFEPIAVFDVEVGVVRIFSDAPVDEFRQVLDRFPGKVDYVGRPFVYLRHNDIEPHWGGAKIVSPDSPGAACTSGFSVSKISSGLPRMLTAGHCFEEVGMRVNSPQGTTFGRVKNRADDVDAELIGDAGISMEGQIYIGGDHGAWLPVIGAGDPPLGTYHCFSGFVELESCQGYKYESNVYKFPVGRGPCPGDSGAPFYTRTSSHVTARGIIQGGKFFGEYPDFDLEKCKEKSQFAFVTTWPRIASAFGIAIMTEQ